MRKRNSIQDKKQRVERERDPIPLRYCLLTLVCGLLLVVGFFWAARQHFSAMDFGIRNAKLRQEKESLEAEQRRLFIAKEILLSPNEIKKAAKKLGLQDLTAQNIEMINVSPNTEKTNSELPAKETPVKTAVIKNKVEKQEKPDEKPESKKPEIMKASDKIKDSKETKDRSESVPKNNPRPQIAKK